MNSTNAVDRNKLILAVEQLVRASWESQLPIAHIRETVTAQRSSLDSIRLRYWTSAQIIQRSFKDVAARTEQNSSVENENRSLLAQLNEAHSGDMEPEERRFLEHSLEYYRRRLHEGK